ncbi:MAG: hypothetical protein WC222_01695 [Parachlamydiales bacterium]|jgi:hypothetical protein
MSILIRSNSDTSSIPCSYFTATWDEIGPILAYEPNITSAQAIQTIQYAKLKLKDGIIFPIYVPLKDILPNYNSSEYLPGIILSNSEDPTFYFVSGSGSVQERGRTLHKAVEITSKNVQKVIVIVGKMGLNKQNALSFEFDSLFVQKPFRFFMEYQDYTYAVQDMFVSRADYFLSANHSQISMLEKIVFLMDIAAGMKEIHHNGYYHINLNFRSIYIYQTESRHKCMIGRLDEINLFSDLPSSETAFLPPLVYLRAFQPPYDSLQEAFIAHWAPYNFAILAANLLCNTNFENLLCNPDISTKEEYEAIRSQILSSCASIPTESSSEKFIKNIVLSFLRNILMCNSPVNDSSIYSIIGFLHTLIELMNLSFNEIIDFFSYTCLNRFTSEELLFQVQNCPDIDLDEQDMSNIDSIINSHDNPGIAKTMKFFMDNPESLLTSFSRWKNHIKQSQSSYIRV